MPLSSLSMGEMMMDKLESLIPLHGSGSSDIPEMSDIRSGAAYENGRVKLEPFCVDGEGDGDRMYARPYMSGSCRISLDGRGVWRGVYREPLVAAIGGSVGAIVGCMVGA